MKGVLICGGVGSRLRPLTDITNKSLLPVYDKPLVCYPLQVLLDAGIREIAIITGPEHIEQMTNFLGNGSRFGCTFAFKVQEKPGGIAQALGLAEEFADSNDVCAILGDNVYFDDIVPVIRAFNRGGHIFLKEVPDPERFGVATVEHGRVTGLQEKPKQPKSNFALTGCYLFDARCFGAIKTLQPSGRNEYEITDVCTWYLEKGELTATTLREEWVDAGTFESLFRAATLIRDRQTQRRASS